ncbi:NAD(P)H-dependent glycerol-3-phosphate dehydrogenase [Desulforhabdus amnigena]|jgi:glycerol-3-phosphate dehydrogenase (NAD(P)+)|uniref:Glycerol-3-phosphate dehydrogenase [NAD(P)+] n=1 Tax=Desulforhabdus amnigena TaxID=40218 RepID=A0A9W6FV73_9BACT|nr:NAD(P)H-dependent glycerol-3-phosphate dehydrogenase [Desulforhabdus amnigena]NLJ28155.1 NAD(P)-dependent glycerol-3-phosphate dehydrogenase [Deltaproteobacteria bacterium]GLI35453.1 glycerol-3-phosphate dehydrogenase [NAD(P)+] [Desulforhabdus amnigena]
MEHSGPIGVLGAGAWGTTLAQLLAEKGYPVDLWVYEEDLCGIIRETRVNEYYLPGFVLSENLVPHNDLESVVKDHDLLVMVVPSHVYRQVAGRMLPYLKPGAMVVNATKGIENETLLTMSGIWKEILPDQDFIHELSLSGPSFAREVSQKIPTAVTVAGDTIEAAQYVQRIFSTDYFRVYTSLDKVGVELAGALKNVIAVAAGACDGLGFGLNSRAALITRGLAEISRLGVKMGAHPLTFAGLAGMGDLVLTCTGDLSRNRSVGMQLGQGKKLKEILEGTRTVAEGVKTTRSAYFLARRMEVEMPITERVYQVLYEDKDPRTAVQELMGRDLKHELEHA